MDKREPRVNEEDLKSFIKNQEERFNYNVSLIQKSLIELSERIGKINKFDERAIIRGCEIITTINWAFANLNAIHLISIADSIEETKRELENHGE